MKKLTGLIIILAVLILGGYYGMGMLTERSVKNTVEVINQSNGLFADIEQYNRGWFSSDATIKWRLHIPERVVTGSDGNSKTVAAQDYQMDMPIKIYHGPFILANKHLSFGMGYAKTMIPFPQSYMDQFNESFSQDSVKPQLDLSIYVNYLNKSTVELSLPSFKLVTKDGSGNFNWLGMESSTSMTSKLSQIEGELVFDGMDYSKADTKVTLGKVTSEYDLHKTPSGLYLGEASLSLPTFDVAVKDQKMFEVNELDINSSSDINDSLFSTHFSASLKSILANGQSFGPGEIEVSVRNLDADVLAKINQQANSMQNGSDAERQQALMQLLPEVPKLFTKGAEFEISKLNLKLPQGTIDGNLLITLPKGATSNPFDLIQKTQGNAKLRVPVAVVKQLLQQTIMQQMANQPDMQKALVAQLQGSSDQANATPPTPEQLASMQVDKQLGELQQTGFVQVDGTDYTIEISLEQGKLTVNGKPFDPTTMKFQ